MANNIRTGNVSGKMPDCIAKIRKDIGGSVTDYTENGKCSRCGACCSVFLPLSEKEIRDIRSHMGKNNIEKPVSHKKPEDKGTVIDMLCPFLASDENENASCTIYEKRPAVCRVFRCDKTAEETVRGMDGTKRKLVHTGETFFPAHYTKQQVQIAKQVHGIL